MVHVPRDEVSGGQIQGITQQDLPAERGLLFKRGKDSRARENQESGKEQCADGNEHSARGNAGICGHSEIRGTG